MSLNAAFTLKQANDFSTDFAGATLNILDGATVLASHTVPSWAASNNGAAGRATAAAISDVTIGNGGGTADGATLTSGGRTITLSVGLSGADLNLSTLTYVDGETSAISSLVVNFPAS